MTHGGRIESIRQRLLNLARANGETFDHTLARYGIERVLYRLGNSGEAERFVLKGATLFHVWNRKPHRPTRDVDLLGFGPGDPESLRSALLRIIRVPCPEDGLSFVENALALAAIRQDTEDGVMRAKFRANLGNIRIPIQIDVGFGDVITPGPEVSEYPTLLSGMPGTRLKTYPTCTVIAEKFEALVRLDALNTRMKDFFDLDFLLAGGGNDRSSLDAAIRATFERRGGVMPTEVPTGLRPAFAEGKQGMWSGFLRKNGIEADDFTEVVCRISNALEWIWNE